MYNHNYYKRYLINLRIIIIAAIGMLTVYSVPVLAENQDRVTICHKPGANEVTIDVAPASLDAHLAHGDMQGSCDEEFKTCPFEPIMLTLSNPDPVKVPVEITTNGQDLNFGANDPPGVYWALTDLDGNIMSGDGPDDHFHLAWAGPNYFSEPGYYYMIFNHPLAGTTYPNIQINLACEFEAPEP